MIQIVNDYCENVIPTLIDDSIDLVVTSPPYNVQLGNNKYNNQSYDYYDDNMTHWQYIEWLQNIFFLFKAKVKKGGRVVINIGDGKNGAIPTSSDVIQFMKGIEYLPYAHIIWNKNTTSNRTAWGSWLSPSSPQFPTPFEHVLVFAMDESKLQEKGETDLSKEEFTKWAYGLWEFPGESRKRVKHPAPFPEEFAKRCIKLFTWKGALVVDPFGGSGTTAKVCQELGRNCISIDISREYCYNALERINNEGELIIHDTPQ